MRMQARDKAPSWMDRLRKALKTNDAEGAEAALAEGEKETEKEVTKDEGAINLHLHSGGPAGTETTSHDGRRMSDEDIENRFKGIEDGIGELKSMLDGKHKDSEAEKAIEGELKEEAPAGTGDGAMKSKDSAFLEDNMRDTVAQAEILVPGIRIPSFDRDASPANGLKAIKSLRKNALELFNLTPAGRQLCEEIVGGPLVLDGMPPDRLRLLFRSIARAQRASNNEGQRGRSDHRDVHTTHDSGGRRAGLGGVVSPAEMNKRMNDYYKNQTA